MPDRPSRLLNCGFGIPWLLLSAALGAHLWDQSAHDFLGYYNATVLALYGHLSWFPRIDMTRHEWLSGAGVVLAVFTALTPFAFRNARWLRAVAYLLAALQLLSGLGYILAQMRGRTVPSVHFDGVVPGFYSVPLTVAASLYLLLRLRKTRNGQRDLPTVSVDSERPPV